jgi:hypothetical protein
MAEPIPYYDNYTYLRDNDFNDLTHQRFNISAKIKELSATLAQVNAEIGTMMTVAGVDKVACDELTVSMVAGKSSHLSKTKLLEMGVGPDTIAAATKETVYTTVRIVESKKRREED